MMYYNARPGLGYRLVVPSLPDKPYVKPSITAQFQNLYSKLRLGSPVPPSEITQEFAVWVFKQYGLEDPVLDKAKELLRRKLTAEADITPTVDEVAPSTYIPGPEPPAVVDPYVSNGFADPAGTVPTFIETAQEQTSPLLKYGLLAVGAFIFIDSLKRTRPRRRSVRRRRRVRR